MLRPGFAAMVDKLDTVQEQIDAFRPQIEMLIYWENLTNTISKLYDLVTESSMDFLCRIYLVPGSVQLFFLMVYFDLVGPGRRV